MTYHELMDLARAHYDPQGEGVIKGPPVMVLYSISSLADRFGWEEQINTVALKERLVSQNSDRASAETVLQIIRG